MKKPKPEKNDDDTFFCHGICRVEFLTQLYCFLRPYIVIFDFDIFYILFQHVLSHIIRAPSVLSHLQHGSASLCQPDFVDFFSPDQLFEGFNRFKCFVHDLDQFPLKETDS